MSSNMQPREMERQLQEHAGFVQSLARRLVRDEAEAADMAQATWLAALEGTVPAAGARAWLAQVLRRKVRRSYVQDANRRAREASSANAQAMDEAASSPDEIVERQEALRRITDAVLALEEPYRSTLILRFHGGHEASEIASRQGVPVATVRSRLQRALARLRTQLDTRYGGDRQAWCLALISLGQLDLGGLPATAAGTASAGAWLMSMKTKIALVAALLLGGTFWGLARTGAEPEPRPLASSFEPELDGSQAPPATRQAEVRSKARTRMAATLDPAPALDPSGEAQLGSVQVQIRWARGASPRPLWVELEHPFASPSERIRRARSDAQGRCTFASVPPGSVQLHGECAGTARAQVRAGELTEVELNLPAGLLVRGKVQDESGAAIANAELWLFHRGDFARGAVVGRSDAAGTFALPGVDPSYRLGAMAPGYEPSAEVWVADLAPSQLDGRGIVLTLRSAAGSAELRAVDEGGNPVPGALVSLTLPPPNSPAPSAATGRPQALQPAYLTAADGTLSLPSLPVGLLVLRTTAAGFAPHSRELRVNDGETTDAVLRLSACARVQGQVLSSSGDPIVNILVAPFLPFEDLIPTARTDAEGRYTLGDLPTGSVMLTARDPLSAWAQTYGTLSLQPGETGTWNPTMTAGRSLAGTIQGGGSAAGAGQVEGRALQARTAGSEFPFAFATSDGLGRFLFPECPQGALEVDLFGSAGIAGLVVQTLPVGPDENAAHFTLSDEPTCLGEIRLRLTESGTAAIYPADRPGSGVRVEDPDPSGRIAFDELCPGTYDVEIRAPGMPKRFSRNIPLAPGEQVDLGTIEPEPMGSLEILVDGEPAHLSPTFLSFVAERYPGDSAPSDDPAMALAAPRSDPVQSVNMQEDASAMPLAPGRYLICANGNADLASQRQPVSIEAGVHTRVDFETRPGFLVSLECRPKNGPLTNARVAAAVADGRGPARVQDLDWNATEGTYSMYTQIEPGTHTFAFQATDGAIGTAVFQVASDGAAGPGQTLVEGPGFQILRIIVPMP